VNERRRSHYGEMRSSDVEHTAVRLPLGDVLRFDSCKLLKISPRLWYLT